MNDDELDRLIGDLPRTIPTSTFMRSVRQIPASNPRSSRFRFSLNSFAVGLGLAASLALGLWTGVSMNQDDSMTGAQANVSDIGDDELAEEFRGLTTNDESLEL